VVVHPSMTSLASRPAPVAVIVEGHPEMDAWAG
jgi:hypothetical protein